MGQETAADWRAALAAASAGYAGSAMRPPREGDPARMGPYRLEAVLGQGGMGRVFLARHGAAEGAPTVALKVLSHTDDATARARVQRGLAAARRVEGDGTARVLDGDPDADPPWLVTEYIEGPTLDRLVAQRGPLPARAAAGLAVGVAGALTSIHAAGVVHRDLKPANIILAPDGPRVVDFGIARTADSTTLSVTGWTMGTPGYMAPEQIVDPRMVGPAVDVFALGAVLVFATCGVSPYAGGDPASVVYRIVHGEPNFDGVPDDLRELVARCLARNPGERPRPDAVAAAGLRIVDRLTRREFVPTTEPILPDPVSAAAQTVVTPSLPEPGPGSGPARRSVAPTGDRLPVRRRRRRAIGILAALLAAALSVSSWFAVEAFGRPEHSASGTGTLSATGGTTAAGSAAAGSKAAQRHSASATAFAGGTVVAGAGCPSTKWTVFSVTSGSLETGISGGDPACGGAVDAFRKSGEDVESGSSAEWSFDFKRPVTCTLKIYIANADPSSGLAVYKIVAGSSENRFRIDQAQNKGTFVANADLDDLSAPDGVIRLTLTDISVNGGDQNHVTASSVSAACQLG